MRVSTGLLLVLLLVIVVDGLKVSQMTLCRTYCDVKVHLYSGNNTVILNSRGSVYWSSDEGQTWTQKLGDIVELYQYERNSSYMVAMSDDTFYTSTDGGANFTLRNPPSFPSDATAYLSLHPHRVGSMLRLYGNTRDRVGYYSLDFGDSWQWIIDLSQAAWGRNPSRPDLVFYINGEGKFGYTENYKDFNLLVSQRSLGFTISDQYLHLAVLDADGEMTIYVSSVKRDVSHTDPDSYMEVVFENGFEVPIQTYKPLGDHGTASFVAIQDNPRLPWGNIFNSEYGGEAFKLSLPFAAQSNSYYDFGTAGGVRGVFLANIVANSTIPIKRTLITYDNGGAWRPLHRPDKSTDNCTGNYCTLHLHGVTSYISGVSSPFYSSRSAPGLIVAVGNVGEELATAPHLMKTYLSRDAGLTWVELASMRAVYEFGDFGGILVYTQFGEAVDYIYYSLDEGLTSRFFVFSTTPVVVTNITSDPSGTGQRFLLYGMDAHNNSVIFGLDFSDEHPRKCTDSDYEIWAPSNGISNTTTCVLGRITNYIRRKQTSQCYNDRGRNITSSTICPCSFDDYECEKGWFPTARNTTGGFHCIPGNDVTPDPDPPAICPPNTPYTVRTGYALIDGTECDFKRGLDLIVKMKMCPSSTTSTTTGGITGATTGVTTGRTTSSITGSTSTTGSHTDGDGDKKGNGATVGIVVAVVAVVSVVGALAFVLWRKPTLLGNMLGQLRRRKQYAPIST